MSSALKLWSPAPVVALIVLVGCSHGQPMATTPRPSPSAPSVAPRPSPPPRIAIALGPTGATFTIADDRCVTVGGQEVCGESTLGPADLGGHPLTEGWVIPAAAFTIANAEVSLEVGEGIEALGPHGDPDGYLRPGAHTHRLRALGWIELREGDDGDEGPEARLERYERAAVAVEAWLDEPRRRLFWAEEETAGAVSIAPENPSAALVQAWLVAAPDWWSRGVADYLSLLIRHQAGALTAELAYDELLDRYTRHRDRPGESPVRADGRAAAEIGALVALCVDIELRTQSSSLPRVLARIDGPIGPEALVDTIAEAHPEIAARHRARSMQRGVIELDGCLRRGGRKLVAHHVPIIDPARLLRVGALDPETAEVRERGRGPLRPGDVIQHVRGRAIRRAWDIVFYLRDIGGRHRFSVSVQRGEAIVRTWLRMIALDDELPTRVRFTAVEDAEADDEGDPFRGPIDDRH